MNRSGLADTEEQICKSMNFDALCHGEPVHVEPGLHLNMSRDTLQQYFRTVVHGSQEVARGFGYSLRIRLLESNALGRNSY